MPILASAVPVPPSAVPVPVQFLAKSGTVPHPACVPSPELYQAAANKREP